MEVYVRYCSKCQTKVSPQEIQRNQAYEYKDNCVCRKCFAKLPDRLQAKIKKFTEKKLQEEREREEEIAQASTTIGLDESSTVKALQNRTRNNPRATEKSDRLMAARSKMYGTGLHNEIPTPSSKSPVPFIVIGAVLILALGAFLLSSKSVPSSKAGYKKGGLTSHPATDNGPKEWEPFEDVADFERDNPLELAQIRDRYKQLLSKAPSPSWKSRVQERVSLVESAIVQAKKSGTYREPTPPRKIPDRPRDSSRPKDGDRKDPPRDNSFYNFMASRRSTKFHKRSCEWGQKISKRNLVKYKTRAQAVQAGRKPCGACRP